jgi:L-lactate permease
LPTFEQVYTPVADSLILSTLVAVIPIAVLFVLLAGFRVAAHWSSLVSLALAIVIAVAVYGMPISLALNSTLAGIAFGLFPIVWIVINTTFARHKPIRAALSRPAKRRGARVARRARDRELENKCSSIYSRASVAGLRLRARLDANTDKTRLSLI